MEESLSGCGDGGAVPTKQQEKPVAAMCGKTGKPDDVKWKCRWFRESESELETEPESESESEEEEEEAPSETVLRYMADLESSEDEYMMLKEPMMMLRPNGERKLVRKYAPRLSYAQIALRRVHLYENDRENIPPHLAPYLTHYFEKRREEEANGKLCSDDFDFSADDEEIEDLLEPATPPHDGQTTAPHDGKRSHGLDGNSSSREDKRSRRHRKRDRSRNDLTDQPQRRSHRL